MSADAPGADVTRAALPEVLETPRLVLRPFRLEDVDDVLAYAADDEWARYLPVPVPYGRSDAVTFLARHALLDRAVSPSWAVELEGSVIGGLDLRIAFDDRAAELGYSVARRCWGRGYATEAARAVVDAAFRTHPDLNRVRAFADLRNAASQRVMVKLGMSKEGVLRQNRVTRGELVDEAWYGLLRAEWEAERASADSRPAADRPRTRP